MLTLNGKPLNFRPWKTLKPGDRVFVTLAGLARKAWYREIKAHCPHPFKMSAGPWVNSIEVYVPAAADREPKAKRVPAQRPPGRRALAAQRRVERLARKAELELRARPKALTRRRRAERRAWHRERAQPSIFA